MTFTTYRKNNGKNRYKRVYRLCGLAAGLILWQVTALFAAQPLIVPTLGAIAAATAAIFADPQFFPTVTATLSRIAVTVAVDTAVAFFLGIAAGLSERIEAVFSPFETAMRAVPTMGILLLSLIWFNSEVTPVFVASLIALPLLYRGVVNGVKHIDFRLTQMSAGFRVPFLRKLTQLYLPSIRPFTLTAYVSALGLLVKVMVTAEVLSQPQKGIGTQFQIARAQLDTATIFGWALIVIILASIIEQVAKRLLSMQKKHHGSLEPNTEPCDAAHIARDTAADNQKDGGFQADRVYAPAALHIDNISFSFDNIPIFKDFSLEIEPAQVRYLLGRSGRGKTTLLFLIAGFLHPDKGNIRINPPDARIGFAYQDIRLLPHLSAEENICYILPRRYTKKEAQNIARQYLRLFGLQGFEHFLPAELSGGMQRRVGLARALAYPSEILLLDEAFDSLDLETKKAAIKTFSRIVTQEHRTVLCVTHDPISAHSIQPHKEDLTENVHDRLLERI